MKIILLAGFSAAGKSTLTRHLSEKYGLYQLKHQELVHGLAVDRGYERARYWLTSIGQDEFMRISLNAMINTIHSHSEGIILDVVYGRNMIEAIYKEFTGHKIFTVYLDIPRETRLRQIMGRMKESSTQIAETELNFRDNFLERARVQELKEVSNLVLDQVNNIDETAEFIWSRLI